MPWKETCTVDERRRFVVEAMKEEAGIAELCRYYGISRKTGYKWLARYDAEGSVGLDDRSHAPLNCPHRLSEEIVEEVLKVRVKHPTWGPKKIRSWLDEHDACGEWPALSTIGELLKSRGLSFARRPRRRVPMSAPLGDCTRPNDVWSVDFKGWFRTADGARCDPLTLKDAHSRYLLRCQAVERADMEHVWPIFDAALREFGLPQRVRSDNGPPFASRAAGGLSRLSVRLIKAGILPERIEPGKPQQNGRHERFHLTLKRETASPPAANLRAQQHRFDKFRKIYNEERPHEALRQTAPGRHYVASPRRYSGRLHEPEYENGLQVRRVRQRGEIKWRGELIFISEVLIGEPIGCEEIGNGIWSLRYGPVVLGTIDHRLQLCVPRRRGTHTRSS